MRSIKIYAIVFVSVLASIKDVLAQSGVNYVKSKVYDQNGQVVSEGISYQDILGRPQQSQVKNITAGQVLGSHTVYDYRGNPALNTLPALTGSGSFGLKSDFLTNTDEQRYSANDFDRSSNVVTPKPVNTQTSGSVGEFYSDNNASEPYVPAIGYPYVRSWSEEGPDPRISKSAGPGTEFKMGSGNEVVTEVKYTDASDPDYSAYQAKIQDYYTTRATYITSEGNLTATEENDRLNQVYRTVITNPQGEQAVAFSDINGRVFASAVKQGNTFHSWTYNYYNDIGQLVATVAPSGTATAGATDFVTTYTYDELGRLINMNSPDEGLIEYVYSTDGRLRFSRNAEQRNASPKRFSFISYDTSLRVIETGEYTEGGGFYVFQPHGSTPVSNSILDLIDTKGAIPVGHASQLTVHDELTYDLVASDFPADAEHPAQEYLMGEVVTTSNGETKTWYSYDELGRVSFIIQKVLALDKTVTLDYTYDFNGNVTQVAYQVGTFEAFYHHYEYDADQRLATVKTSLDGDPNGPFGYKHATYHYYLHGPLKRIELADDLQGIDYVYTAQGWPKAINHPDMASDPGEDGSNGFIADVFGQTFEYYSNDYSRTGSNISSITLDASIPERRDGNLRAISWGKNKLGIPEPINEVVLDTYQSDEASARRSVTLIDGFDTYDSGTSTYRDFEGFIDPVASSTPVNEPAAIYAYKYDDKNQLTDAIFDEKNGFSASSNTNRVTVGYADDNGKIGTLNRKDDTGSTKHNFTYNYVAGTNKLASITGYATYTYNSIGQLTAVDYNDASKPDLYLKYDAYGNMIEVYGQPAMASEDLKISYAYDDRGHRLMKQNHETGHQTWYMRDPSGNIMSIYYHDGTELIQGELPIYGANRIGIAFRNTSHYKYNYEITDHLGNVRTVVSKLKFMETATMETDVEVQNVEEGAFTNMGTRHTFQGANHTGDPDTTDTYIPKEVARLNPAEQYTDLNGIVKNRAIGPAKSLAVTPGDQVDMEVWAYYEDISNGQGMLPGGLAPHLVQSLNYTVGENSVVFGAVDNVLTNLAVVPDNLQDVPKAYLQYLLFDINYNPVTPPAGWGDSYRQISSAAQNHEKLSISLTVPANAAFMFIYVANESNDNVNVFFDDFMVKHTGVDILETSDYYPFGSMLSYYQRYEDQSYRFGYQGQYAEEDTLTGFNSFTFRTYDPVIGMWLSPDPARQYANPYSGMGNNPVNLTDPLGLSTEPGAYQEDPIDGGAGGGDGNYYDQELAALAGENQGRGEYLGNDFYHQSIVYKDPGSSIPNAGDLTISIYQQQLPNLLEHVPNQYFETFLTAVSAGFSGGNQRKLGDAVINGKHNFLQVDALGNFYLPYTDQQVDPSIYIPGTAPDPNAGVGLSGNDGFIPVWGSARDALYWFQQGDISRGITNSVLAVSDVFLVRAIAGGVGKATLKSGTQNRRFWTQSNFDNVKVFQRNDLINPKFVDATGRSNLQRMQKGLAPIGPDGKSINLHHMLQTNRSAIAEMTETFHKTNHRIIHLNPNTIQSGINRTQFNAWRRNYWMNRAKSF